MICVQQQVSSVPVEDWARCRIAEGFRVRGAQGFVPFVKALPARLHFCIM